MAGVHLAANNWLDRDDGFNPTLDPLCEAIGIVHGAHAIQPSTPQ